MLRGEVEVAVHSLEAGKSPGVDNIPSEPLKNGGEATTTVLLVRRLVISLLKKGDLKQCQKYRTINLISHPSKIMLPVIFNQLKAKAEEHAGRRTSRFYTRLELSRTDLQ